MFVSRHLPGRDGITRRASGERSGPPLVLAIVLLDHVRGHRRRRRRPGPGGRRPATASCLTPRPVPSAFADATPPPLRAMGAGPAHGTAREIRRRLRRRHHHGNRAGRALAPWLAPYDPSLILDAAGGTQPPSAAHGSAPIRSVAISPFENPVRRAYFARHLGAGRRRCHGRWNSLGRSRRFRRWMGRSSAHARRRRGPGDPANSPFARDRGVVGRTLSAGDHRICSA